MKTLTAFMISIVMANASLAQTSNRLQVADFKTSANCKQCHQQFHDQWMTSMHSQAYRDPIYQVFLRRVDEQRQGKLTLFCVSCHAPLATVTRVVPV